MKQGFEDAFMDLQSEYISLCMEVCGDLADEIDVLIYQDQNCCAFNAFFVEKGAVKTADAYADDPLVERFLEMGTEDIDKLLNCCEEYSHTCPNELRLIYDTRTGHFDARYQYRPVLETEDLSFFDLFNGWISEKKEALRK